MESLSFGSLFAGIGGLDLGLERAGMTCQWQVEIDDYATRVLEKHWPNVRRWRDVRTFPPTGEWGVDLICGGFPCQDISYAGRGAGLEGERSGLFFEAIRVVRQLRPRIVLLENVAALLTRGLDIVLGTLAEVGYDAEWHCIPAAYVGAPHIRDRVFIVAFLPDALRTISESGTGGRRVWQGDSRFGIPSGLRSSGMGNPDRSGFSGDNIELVEGAEITTSRNSDVADAAGGRLPIMRGTPREAGLVDGGDESSDWWATEPDVGRVAYGIPKRVDRLRGLGNAVVPQCAEWIGRRILEVEKRFE